MNADGQSGRTMTDRRHPGLWLSGRLEALDMPDQRIEQRFGLEQRKRPAYTGVNAVAPTHVAAQVAPDVEPFRRRPLAWIAVCGSKHEAATLSLGNYVALDLDVSGGDASRHA